MNEHDRALSAAFDSQAERFERAPVQSDPVALERLARKAGFGTGSRVLDAGCGPGLVTEALLRAGCRVVGVDLSREMIERAQKRCGNWGDQAEFHRISVFDSALDSLAPFDGTISRYVLHHVNDALAFVTRQSALLRPAGTLVLSDHVTDPDPDRARHHQAMECARDQTHTLNLTGGQLVDLLALAGLEQIELVEEPFVLDFDEWFDRGTPQDTKDNVRAILLSGPPVRGFEPTLHQDGSIRIEGIRCIVKGVKPTVQPAS
jgi:SAM-dependent methyltransferase